MFILNQLGDEDTLLKLNFSEINYKEWNLPNNVLKHIDILNDSNQSVKVYLTQAYSFVVPKDKYVAGYVYLTNTDIKICSLNQLKVPFEIKRYYIFVVLTKLEQDEKWRIFNYPKVYKSNKNGTIGIGNVTYLYSRVFFTTEDEAKTKKEEIINKMKKLINEELEKL